MKNWNHPYVLLFWNISKVFYHLGRGIVFIMVQIFNDSFANYVLKVTFSKLFRPSVHGSDFFSPQKNPFQQPASWQ